MIQAIFERKPDFRFREAQITKVIRLPTEEYERFLNRPCDEYELMIKNSTCIWMTGAKRYLLPAATGE